MPAPKQPPMLRTGILRLFACSRRAKQAGRIRLQCAGVGSRLAGQPSQWWIGI